MGRPEEDQRNTDPSLAPPPAYETQYSGPASSSAPVYNPAGSAVYPAPGGYPGVQANMTFYYPVNPAMNGQQYMQQPPVQGGMMQSYPPPQIIYVATPAMANDSSMPTNKLFFFLGFM